MTTYYRSCAYCSLSMSGPDELPLVALMKAHNVEAHPEKISRKRAIPFATRRAVAVAAGHDPAETHSVAYCAYCGVMGGVYWPRRSNGEPGGWVHFVDLELDHVIPEDRGGPSTADNVVLACRPCNRSKGSRTPEEWGGPRGS